MLNIGKYDPLGVAVMKAIQSGDLDALRRLLGDNPGLVTARIDGRTLLHVVADWPGHFPNGAAVVTALIAAGADHGTSTATNSVDEEHHIHWAASSGDVAVLDTLIVGGADMEALVPRPSRAKPAAGRRSGLRPVAGRPSSGRAWPKVALAHGRARYHVPGRGALRRPVTPRWKPRQ